MARISPTGVSVDVGAAHEQTWKDAKGTLACDFMSSGMALLLGTAFGSNGKLTQSGTTTAYELGGATGIKPEAPESHNEKGEQGTCFDMQLGVPTNSGEVTPWNYHSCMITKAEFVFDRVGLVTASFDWDAQKVENSNGPDRSDGKLAAAAPFTMGSTSSVFTIGGPPWLGINAWRGAEDHRHP